MHRRRAVLILLLGLVSGLFAVVLASRYLSNVKGGSPAPQLESVVIAKHNVARGERLTKEDLELASWPPSLVVPSAVREIEQAVNRVTAADLAKGEPVLLSKLAPVGTAPGLAALIPAGMRGVTVRVNEVIGVAGFLRTGSRVDVLTTMEVGRRGGNETVTKVVLQNIQVLAVGSEQDVIQKKMKKVSVVTLLVTPGQAERLTLASTRGEILLALRNNQDKMPTETPGITPPELIFGEAPAPPEPKPAPKIQEVSKPSRLRRIEVIRGGERSHESLAQQPKNRRADQ